MKLLVVRRCVGLGLLLAGAGVLRGQDSPIVYTFHLARPGLPVPEYTFQIGPDSASSLNSYTTTGSAQELPSSRTEQPLHLSEPTRLRLARLFRATNGLTGCASKAKGIADTGTKTLSEVDEHGDAKHSCSYNYSESKPVVELTALFQGMALTLDEGRRLEMLHRYDRLGLDGEMKALYDAAKDGRALEMGNIAATLRSLADDTEVLQRVRERAADLLKTVPAS